MRTRTTAVLTTGLLLLGLSACGGVGDVDLDRITEQARSGLDDARGSLEEVEQAVQDAAELDGPARAAVQDATDQAREAIASATTAVQDGAAPGAVDQARRALEDAQASIAEASAGLPGPLATSLDGLAAQIDELVASLAP